MGPAISANLHSEEHTTASPPSSSPDTLATCLAYLRKSVQQRHEATILHRPKHRSLAQLRTAHTRTADTKSHTSQKARVVAFWNRHEHSSESFAVPRDLWRFLELHGLMRLAPRAVATFFFALRQRIAEMFSQCACEALLACDQIGDLVHSCEILLLANLQLLVHAVR